MPHALLKDFQSNLPKYVALALGKLEAAAITYIMGKVNEILAKLMNTCPPPKELEKLSKTINSLKGLMNKFDKQTGNLKKIPDAMVPAVIAGKVVVEILSHMPLPSTIGLPPGPAGGVIFSVPLGIIQAQSNTLVFTRKMVETLEADQKSIKDLLKSTDGLFDPIKNKLTLIESLLAKCIQNPNLSNEERSNIITAAGKTLNTDSNYREDYIAQNGNTYKLSIREEPNQNFTVPKRQAIAKDFRGIIVLTGPNSYAGDTKVLIDELKFRIDNQLP